MLGIVLGTWLLGAVPVLAGIVLVSGHGWVAQLLVRVRRRKQLG